WIDLLQARERGDGIALVLAHAAQEREWLRRGSERRLPGGKPLKDGAQLQERVVAKLRHRGVSGGPAGTHREAKDALLRTAHSVVALAVQLEVGTAALVEQHVTAHLLGVGLCQPLGAQLAAGLLV